MTPDERAEVRAAKWRQHAEQAEAQRDRALEQLAAERSAHEQTRDELAQTEALLATERAEREQAEVGAWSSGTCGQAWQ